MLPLPLQFVILGLAGWINRRQQEVIAYLEAENRVLREQVGPGRLRFTNAQRSRLARAAPAIGRKRFRQIATIVTPDALLRWYRELVPRKYDGSQKRGPGRPRIAGEIQRPIVEMAHDNPGWGYTRIRGALDNLGYSEIRNTIKRILLAISSSCAQGTREARSLPRLARRRLRGEFAYGPDRARAGDRRFLSESNHHGPELS